MSEKKEKPAGPSLIGMVVAAGFLLIGPAVMIHRHTSTGAVVGGFAIWAAVLIVAAYALGDVLACRRVHAFYARKDQHKDAVEVPTQRDRNRAWIKHAREHGATDVRIWFAEGEYDDAEQIDVSIREALGVLAKHVNDYHVDAAGLDEHGDDVTVYLSEFIEAAA